MSSFVETTAGDDEVEFRSYLYDAWYSARLVLEGEKLRIKYSNFTDQHDDIFEATKFDSLQELGNFESRFRMVSVQLQDCDCAKVVRGLTVCVSHSVNGGDVSFYDAVVDDVWKNEHSFTNGEEECLCSFIVILEQGPCAGGMVEKTVENICLIQSRDLLDPNLASFLEIAREKIGKKHVKRPVIQFSPSEGWISGKWVEENRQDIDVGAACILNMILLENLEKELSTWTIIEFIHRNTSIACQAFVYPSLSSELYARAAIIVDHEKYLKDLYAFLNNPDHFIVSFRGRPWVVPKNFSRHDILRAPTRMSTLKSQLDYILKKNNSGISQELKQNNSGISQELKLVRSGTEEYKRAKELRDLFIEFALHQERLQKRLAMEERKILQPPSAASQLL